MLRATGKSQPVSSFYRAGTQDSRDGEAGQPGTLASGSQSSALLHLHKSEGILPSPSRAYAVSGEVAGVLGEELLRGFPWREKSRGGWGGFLTPSPAPTHIQKHSGRNFISKCPFSRELSFPGDVWWRYPFLPASLAATRRLWLPLLPRAATERVPCDLYK